MAAQHKLQRIIRYQHTPCPQCEGTGCATCNNTGTAPGEPQPITTGDIILQAIRANQTLETACGIAGIDSITLRKWCNDGAVFYGQVERGDKKRRDLSLHQRALMDFSRDIQVALAEAQQFIIGAVAAAGTLATRKIRTTVTTRTLPNGDVVTERQTVEEIGEPDWRAAAWMAERRWRSQWGEQSTLEVVPGEPRESEEAKIDALIERAQHVRGKLQAVPPLAIEAQSFEANGNGSNGNGSHPPEDEAEEA